MKFKLFFGCFFLLLSGKIFAQSTSFANAYLDDRHGLPQNSIKDISKDKNGFIWLSTESGVVRFNGKRFKVFQDLKGSTSSRMDNFLYKNDSLIVRNIKNEFFYIEDSKITPIDSPLKPYEYLPLYKEFNFIPDFFHVKKTEYTYVYSHQDMDYFTRNDSVFLYQNEKQLVAKPILNFKIKYSFGLEGRYFAVDEKFNFYEFDLATKKYESIFEEIKPLKQFKIIQNSSSNQLFLCTENKVYKLNFDLAENKLELFLVHNNLNVQNEFINHIYYDEELKITYFGSWSNGLILTKKNLFTILKVPDNRFTNLQYAFDFIGDTLITEKGVLFYDDKPIQQFAVDPEIKTFFVPNSKGEYYYSRFRTLYRKDINAIFEQPEKVFEFNDDIYALYIDSLDRIYTSTRKFNTHTESRLYRLDLSPKAGISLDTIAVLTADVSYINPKNEEQLWLGTENGLYTFDLASQELSLLKGTENSFVRSITKFDNRWWISSYNNGFFLHENGKVTKIPIGNNLNLLTSHHVLEDDFGGLWISTNRGLYNTSIKDVLAYVKTGINNIIFYEFTVEDGLSTNEFNGGCYPCSRKLPNGELIFPSLNGIVKFNPKDFQHYFKPHAIYIDEVFVNDSIVQLQNFYRLPVGKHNTEFYLNTSEFNRNVQYSYKNSIDNKLISKGKLFSNEVFWNGISTGVNKMQFGITDADFENDNYQVVFEVEAYFYQTLWFNFAIGLVIVLSVLFIFLSIQAKKDATRKQIERIVAAQTSQIRENINELNIAKKALENQLQKHKKLIGSITHDIKSPLIYLGYGIDFLKDELAKANFNKEDVIENLNAIDDSVNKLKEYTENILSFSKASLIEANTTDVEVNLNELISTKVDLFKQMANIKRIDFIFNAKKQIYFKVNKSILSVILHNLIDNSIKNTIAGYVKVELKKIGKRLIIKVKDTGTGMDEETLLNYKNLLTGNTNQNISGSGLGMYIIAESIKLINAKISVESEKGKGTEVVLTLLEKQENNDK